VPVIVSHIVRTNIAQEYDIIVGMVLGQVFEHGRMRTLQKNPLTILRLKTFKKKIQN
jgi:hypothetical protein